MYHVNDIISGGFSNPGFTIALKICKDDRELPVSLLMLPVNIRVYLIGSILVGD